MDEKKKTLVVSVLGVMFIAIGAFQFMPKGEPPPATPAKKELPKFLQENAAANAEPKKNPLVANNLAPRDPFAVLVAPPPVTPEREQPPVKVDPIPQPNREIEGSIGPVTVDLNNPGGDSDKEPVAPEDEAPPFAYTVGGIVVGARPVAVFHDAQGNQRMVLEGASLDGDTKVTAIRPTYVTVTYRGKALRLPVGGESVVK